MRFLLTLLNLFFFTLLFAQVKKTSSDHFQNSKKKTEIIGHIKNYVPGEGNKFITVRFYDITGNYKDTISLIDKVGSFSLLIFQPYTGNIEMKYKENWITLYVLAQKKTLIEIDDLTWEKGPNKAKGLTVLGQTGVITNLILDYKYSFKKENFKTSVIWEDSTLSDEAVANLRIKRMHEEMAFLKRYINKNKITNTSFINWAKNEIYYTAGGDILFESFTNVRKKSLNDRQLMKIIDEIPLNSSSAIHNASYYNFLYFLAKDLVIIVNINPIYKDAAVPYGMNPIPVYLKKVDDYSKGFAKQLMYYSIYSIHSTKKTNFYLETFQSVIKDPYLKNEFAEKKQKLSRSFEPYDLVKKLTQYKIADSLKRRLIDIFESEKNNYVFIDFWGDWCMPCMKEMPFYSQFINQFKDQKISFIFFGVNTDDQRALEIKNKYGINGKFIMLNDIEVNIMNNALQFQGYPSHFVLQPGSIVADDTIARISAGGTELDKAVVEKIKKLLLSKYP